MVEKGYTVDDLIALLSPQILQLPPNRRRDPGKRALLARLGDPVILAEDARAVEATPDPAGTPASGPGPSEGGPR